MAHPTEQEIMNAIGLGTGYHYFNGSGSCRGIARKAIEKLPEALAKAGMDLDRRWAEMLGTAHAADNLDSPGGYSLTNVWVACSYAIQDAMYRQQDPKSGIDPKHMRMHFFHTEKRKEWERMVRSWTFSGKGRTIANMHRYREPSYCEEFGD